MKPENVRTEGSKLARHPTVAPRIAELRAPAIAVVKESIGLDLQRVLLEQGRLATFDIGSIYDPETNELRPIKEWTPAARASVKKIKTRALFGEGSDGKGQIGTVTEVDLWDKTGALEALMKNLGGYAKDNEQKNDGLNGLSREVLKLIEDRIGRLIAGRPVLVGEVTARSVS